jgi:hypothetical protein
MGWLDMVPPLHAKRAWQHMATYQKHEAIHKNTLDQGSALQEQVCRVAATNAGIAARHNVTWRA